MLSLALISSLLISSVYSDDCEDEKEVDCLEENGCLWNSGSSMCEEGACSQFSVAGCIASNGCVMDVSSCIDKPCTDWTSYDDCVDIGVDCDWTTGVGGGCGDIDCAASGSVWRVEYMGSSTQFTIYDVCDDSADPAFIKVKMNDLIEYDVEGKATKNKVTSFASSEDWTGDNDLVEFDGNGAVALYNVFIADILKTQEFAKFTLETYFFREASTIDDPDDLSDAPATIEVPENSLKFSVKIEGWEMIDDVNNYLTFCISITTNVASSSNPDFITNPTVATCDGTATADFVDVESSGNDNQMEICYTFDPCPGGDIEYDPLLHITDNSSSRNIFIAVIMVCIVTLFV